MLSNTPSEEIPNQPLISDKPEEKTEDPLALAEIKISYVEYLGAISYLTRAIEDALIKRVGILKFPLLLIDIPLILAVIIVNTERILYTYVIEYFLAHIRFDISVITNGLKRLFGLGQNQQIEEEEEVYEESTSGKLFQRLRQTIRFLWGLLIFGLFLPIWPLIFIYNKFIEIVIIGALYYILVSYHFPEWWGALLYFIIFATVTFIIASISVPGLLRTFTYLKYLFSIERKSWREINNEAKLAFLSIYLRMQKNPSQILDSIESGYDKTHKAEGGVYYLFLKTIYGIKDRVFSIREKPISKTLGELDLSVKEITSDIASQKESYERAVSLMTPGELFKTAIALILTFVFSAFLLLRGSHGEGITAPIIFSFIDTTKGLSNWVNYKESGLGYFQYLTQYATFLPGILKGIALGVDTILNYFFQAYYYILPLYIKFFSSYYNFYFSNIFSKIFY